MRDYKVYLPHHRSQQIEGADRRFNPISVVALVLICGVMVFQFIDGLDRSAVIAEAEAKARKAERQRIYTANQDILTGHDAYVKQLDAMIDKAYRQGR